MTTLNLPFDHMVIGKLSASNYTFVTICRNTSLHPFVTYDIEVDGMSCTNGGYHATRSEAFTDLYQRAMRRLT